jgi:hypothetical protein
MKKIPMVIKSIYSLADLGRYLVMLTVFFRLKLSGLLARFTGGFGRRLRPSLRVRTP